ncbi:phosphatidylglycerophosphatase A family protein [Tabrizicola fusiformis]|uniref:phosphatidylglycerophosphatase A family protein n=1 Tax=Tabrizicola sp. SY72 TaxID=2741673 RepID=UPI001573D1BB|nr:phosphatidylglycerophosphatase A [Tabrizicola sp. SY72]NTT87456.1 phosphatidylglycerophosphatase A [Tabrizicola sp. SY72]
MTRLLAIWFGVGLLRPAPGTWGSLVAVLLGWTIDRYLGFPALVTATVLVTLLGFWAVGVELRDRPGDDPGEFVIDEVAGQWIALLLPAAAFWARGWEGWLPWPAPLAAFLFFRLFDIRKPWLVGRADRRGDAAGVMLDDLWAGLFAGIATILAAAAWHLPLILMR